MSWEFYDAGNRGGRNMYGPDWQKYPAVSMNKGGLTVNAMAAEAFGMKAGQYVRLAVNSARRAIGLKVIPNGESLIGAIKMQSHDDTSKIRPSLKITCGGVTRRFPDCQGHAYRAHLNAGERIIEVDLSPENMLKGY